MPDWFPGTVLKESRKSNKVDREASSAARIGSGPPGIYLGGYPLTWSSIMVFSYFLGPPEGYDWGSRAFSAHSVENKHKTRTNQ